jgi:hypothetical protein
VSRAVPAAAGLRAVVLLAAALAGCGSREAAAPRGSITLEEARRLDEFPLFYAGERVAGFPLVAIVRRDDTARYVSFVYGRCEPAPLEGGCAPPVEIQVWPNDARNAGSYGASALGSPAPERTTVRGLPAAHVGDGQLEIYASDSTVVVFSASRERGLAVAAALRCLRGGTAAGELRC